MTNVIEPSSPSSSPSSKATTNGHSAVDANPITPHGTAVASPKPVVDGAALRRLLGGLPLSTLVGVALWLGLVWAAGPWNVLANTRVLDFFFDAGVVALTDADAGFIEGLPAPDYFLKSQDPVDWHVVALVGVIFLLFWWLKALQFHDLANYHGLRTTFGQNIRAYFRGLLYERTLPWGFGEAAAAAELEAHGAEPRRVHSILFLANAFVVFEIAVFALYGLFGLGWGAWFMQLFWALVILTAFWLWSRPMKATRLQLPSGWEATKTHFWALLRHPGRLLRLSALSLLAFGLEDVAAYLVAMAFTSTNVILNVDFSVLLMGVVGSYIARLIRFTPGGLGQFEWGFAAALYIGGVGLPEAATIAILDNLFRYATFGIVWLAMQVWPGVKSGFGDVCRVLTDGVKESPQPHVQSNAATDDAHELTEIPAVPAPYVPPTYLVWRRMLFVFWLGLFYFFDRFTVLLADFWMLQSLQLSSVFWTNFNMGATLFVGAFVAFFTATLLPAIISRLPRRQISIFAQVAIQVGLFAAMQLSAHYLDFLVLNGEAFGQVDPVFGRDIGFYIFTLPAYETLATYTLWAFAILLISSIISAWVAAVNRGVAIRDIPGWLSVVGTPVTQVAVVGLGLASSVALWLTRYGLLLKDNSESALPTGAEYVDVNGLFSTLNQIQLTSVLIVIDDILIAAILFLLYRAGHKARRWPGGVRQLAVTLVALLVIDIAFAAGVYIRDIVGVRPNEPVVQLPYIQRHIDATRAAYGLDSVELVEFRPKNADAPLPTADELLASPVLKNAPLWPGYASYLEPVLDPQHRQRILQTGGDHMVYGPTLEIFRQQQKLRTYYDFMSVDPLRYTENGETKVFVSSVRELPLLDPQPWLTWWGQRFLLFTHGYGMVMAPVGEVSAAGTPNYALDSIPVNTAHPALAVENPRIYFGEGSVTMAISNIRDLKEFDYPTEQGRAENVLVEDGDIGVPVDSLLKRIVFGWRSGQFFEMVFSSLLTPETHLQYYRTPLVRLERIAPFLYFDSNLYAVPNGDDIVWLVNGMTATDRYPYSYKQVLGDKSVSRGPEHAEMRTVNYVEDSVKATVSAADGSVKLYQISNNPIIATWASVYPDLFIDTTANPDLMPAPVRQQLTYPLQLFHIQFDDIFILYHMQDATYFFNMEDMWDDADEVLGPIMDEGKAINFSIEPYHQLLATDGVLPPSHNGSQFALMSVFTPENALNLRGIPIAYQDGDDYGRLMVLQIPKGTFVMSPEQADATIDQDPAISQQIALWNRQGAEVIRGHTTLLIVNDELLYVEPIFIRSKQNPVTQLKQVAVVFRGQPYMAPTLEAAIQLAVGEGTEGSLAVTTP